MVLRLSRLLISARLWFAGLLALAWESETCLSLVYKYHPLHASLSCSFCVCFFFPVFSSFSLCLSVCLFLSLFVCLPYFSFLFLIFFSSFFLSFFFLSKEIWQPFVHRDKCWRWGWWWWKTSYNNAIAIRHNFLYRIEILTASPLLSMKGLLRLWRVVRIHQKSQHSQILTIFIKEIVSTHKKRGATSRP